MRYEEPIMEILMLGNVDVITLSNGGEFTDETPEKSEDGGWI